MLLHWNVATGTITMLTHPRCSPQHSLAALWGWHCRSPQPSRTHWDWWLQAQSVRGRHPVPDGTRPYSLSINTGYRGQNKVLNAVSPAALILAGRASRTVSFTFKNCCSSPAWLRQPWSGSQCVVLGRCYRAALQPTTMLLLGPERGQSWGPRLLLG